ETDWRRVLTDDPYESVPLYKALSNEPDWKNFGPSYVDAVAYAYTCFAGYLRLRTDRDFVLILIGDHQPPALVSGEGAPWDVPVHIVASRPSILERLKARGFREGLTPSRPDVSRMHELLPVVLESFGCARRRQLATT